jgi:hypothetical protein
MVRKTLCNQKTSFTPTVRNRKLVLKTNLPFDIFRQQMSVEQLDDSSTIFCITQ